MIRNALTRLAKHVPLILAAFTGIVFILFQIEAYMAESRLVIHGGRATGTIISKRSDANQASGQIDYSITYRFSPSGSASFTKKIGVGYSEWKETSVNEALIVAFNPNSPSQNHPVALGIRSFRNLVLICVLIAPCVSLSAYFLFICGQFAVQHYFGGMGHQ